MVRSSLQQKQMRRFYLPQRSDNDIITIDAEQSHHITKVLRLQPGHGIELYDDTGFLYQTSITEVGKAVRVRVESKEYFAPPRPAIILHAGLLKNKKMELVLQKATELGVAETHLFTSDHTSVTLPDKKRLLRYQKIITESCKQCERIHPMRLNPPSPLGTQIQAIDGTNHCYLFWEREQTTPPNGMGDLTTREEIHIFTGPEGGFSGAEIANLPPQVKTISLGQQILRAETAVITAVTIVSYLAGRLNP